MVAPRHGHARHRGQISSARRRGKEDIGSWRGDSGRPFSHLKAADPGARSRHLRGSIHHVTHVVSLGVAGYALEDPDELNELADSPSQRVGRGTSLKRLARRLNRHPITIQTFVVLNVVSYISAFTELSLREERTLWQPWLPLDLFFLTAIFLERLLHLAVFCHSKHRNLLWSSHWLYFDLVLVGTSPLRFWGGEQWTRWWTALRAFRVLYVFRATRYFERFQALLETLSRAVQRSFAPLALIFFFTTFYAMFGVAFFSQVDTAYDMQPTSPTDPSIRTGPPNLSYEYSGRYWSTTARAMLTLFQVWTNGSHTQCPHHSQLHACTLLTACRSRTVCGAGVDDG